MALVPPTTFPAGPGARPGGGGGRGEGGGGGASRDVKQEKKHDLKGSHTSSLPPPPKAWVASSQHAPLEGPKTDGGGATDRNRQDITSTPALGGRGLDG